MPTTKPKGGSIVPRQFRFTEQELDEIDELGREMSPACSVTRIAVLRAAIRESRAIRKLTTDTATRKDRP